MMVDSPDKKDDKGRDGFDPDKWVKKQLERVRTNSGNGMSLPVRKNNYPSLPTWSPDDEEDDKVELFDNDTPPYEIRPTENQPVEKSSIDPVTVVHESMFSPEVRLYLGDTIRSVTRSGEVLDDVFGKLLDVDLSGGTSTGFLPLIILSTTKRPGVINISESKLADFIGDKLGRDLLQFGDGDHDFIDNQQLIYRVTVLNANAFMRKRSVNVTLGLNVSKI